MKGHIPNILTLLNLFCGCCAILCVLDQQYVVAFWLLFTAGWFDFFDGLVARWLNVQSPLGGELDSMADMVSFGIVPGMILYVLLRASLGSDSLFYLPATPAFLLSALAGLRLAKFNLDTRQTDSFIGLPTPAMTMYVTGLMLVYHFDSLGLRDLVTNTYFVGANILLLSYLLVAEIPMFSFKMKKFQWKNNEIQFIIMGLVILLTVLVREVAFSLVVILYVLFSLIQYFRQPKTV
ncbi:MAG: CDP-diacylglycerol--serine O-phosphatidyltransferase [Saprospiraceae bacterium]